jgi:hypothetical protein
MSIFDHPDDVPAVATWRCPHCATLQPESTRCWACGRSPMTCATCRYYRRSVIGPVGFCGLDRTRALLAGDEVKPCWQAPTDLVDLVSDRPGSGRTSWLTLAERQRSVPTTAGAALTPSSALAQSSALVPSPARVDAPPVLTPPGVHASRAASHAPASGPASESDDLVEAPVVQPARKVVSAAQRRARARRERQMSPLDDERVL